MARAKKGRRARRLQPAAGATPTPVRAATPPVPAQHPAASVPSATAGAKGGSARAVRATDTTPDMVSVKGLAGGRISLDTGLQFLGGTPLILSPLDPEDLWRQQNLDTAALDQYTPAQLQQMLADLSPEVSKALWDFLRLCNPGWEATAFLPGAQAQEPSTQGQEALDAFIDQLHDLYGSVDVVINRLLIAGFLRGAFCAELVLDKAGRSPVDIATPDPDSLRFQQYTDPVRGIVWRLGQWQLGGFTLLDRPTIRYIPIDPFPGVPYGRPLASPALFVSLFSIGLLHDLRRVIAQQGYPRIDISLNLETLKASMPDEAGQDPDTFLAWANALYAEVRSAYAGLQPDDAFVHSSIVEIKPNVGTMNAASLGMIDSILNALERMAMRALKSVPLLMGLDTAHSTESASNRQWESMLASIKAVQHLCETMLERLLELSLQCQGIAATVQFRFAENRASEEQRDATTMGLKIGNARQLYNAGYVSQDEAAQMVVGHPADVPEPRVLERGETLEAGGAAAQATAAAADTADEGSKRAAPLRVVGED